MYIIDLVSFFPDRSYGVSSARSFTLLGLSIWTPWREIYAKLLATTGRSAKYGMLLFIRCIGDIYFQLTTFSSCFIIKFFQIRIPRGVLYELLHSLWARVIEDLRDIFFLMEARLWDEFRSLHNRWQLISLSNTDVHRLDASLFWKVSLSLCDIIKEEGQYTPVTPLEYLKHLHLVEWDNLVKDTKILAEEADMFNG